jgi:hypothetical protein
MGISRPNEQSSKRRIPSWRSISLVLAGLSIFAAVAWVYAGFGSVRGAIDFYHGKYIYVRNTRASFSHVAPGKDARVSYTIENRGNRRYRILGCGMGCAGYPAGNLPMTLEPGKAYPFPIDVRVFAPRPGRENSFHMPVTVYTDNPYQPELILWIDWTVDAPTGIKASLN